MICGRLDHRASTWQSASASWTAWLSIRVRAGLESADRDDLVPGSDLDSEGAWAVAQDNIGAVIGLLQGREDAAVMHPDEGSAEEVPRKSYASWRLQLCLLGKEKKWSI